MTLLEACDEFNELAQPSIRYCRDHGLDWSAVEAATGGVFLVPTRPVRPRSFEFCPGGRLVAMCEVFDEDGETVIDLAAWSLADPHRFGTMFGRAPALGMAFATNPASGFTGQPLRLFRTPLGWLRAGCQGSVLLDRARGARWLLDLGTSKFGAEDDHHAAELEQDRAQLFGEQSFLVPARPQTEQRHIA